MDLSALVEAVGEHGPVEVVGARRRAIGGAVDDGARPVRAPSGVVEVLPDEMTVRVGAGTPVSDLQHALGEVGQFVALPDGGTVGGALAVGRSGPLRLGHGPVRDTLLQARVVSAQGREVKAGGPTVKNVSGFDLCRLLVGSLGTLAVMGEVILRTRPRPLARRWLAGPADPFRLAERLFRPAAVLWDGTTTWVCLEGHPADVDAQALAAGLPDADGPPVLPDGGRLSRRPSTLPGLAEEYIPGTFVAEVGVGVVHLPGPVPVDPPDPAVVALNRRVKAAFDPEARLNPGRRP